MKLKTRTIMKLKKEPPAGKRFLEEPLKPEVLSGILEDLFGFYLSKDLDGNYIILDEDGNEFYGFTRNENWDLFCLKGIIKYYGHLAETRGRDRALADVRSALGL